MIHCSKTKLIQIEKARKLNEQKTIEAKQEKERLDLIFRERMKKSGQEKLAQLEEEKRLENQKQEEQIKQSEVEKKE